MVEEFNSHKLAQVCVCLNKYKKAMSLTIIISFAYLKTLNYHDTHMYVWIPTTHP